MDPIEHLLDSFEIPEERVKDIVEQCHKVADEGDIIDNMKTLCKLFEGKELAYIMFRMGVNAGGAYATITGAPAQSAMW